MPLTELSEVPGASKRLLTKQAGRKRFVPDINATGAHTVFRRDLSTGRITHYETYIPQTNKFDPKLWESIKRFDKIGDEHWNKILQEDIFTPHVHEKICPGGIRPAMPWEIPI